MSEDCKDYKPVEFLGLTFQYEAGSDTIFVFNADGSFRASSVFSSPEFAAIAFYQVGLFAKLGWNGDPTERGKVSVLKALPLNLAEAKLALKGVADLPWSDAGSDLCSKLEAFISCQKKSGGAP